MSKWWRTIPACLLLHTLNVNSNDPILQIKFGHFFPHPHHTTTVIIANNLQTISLFHSFHVHYKCYGEQTVKGIFIHCEIHMMLINNLSQYESKTFALMNGRANAPTNERTNERRNDRNRTACFRIQHMVEKRITLKYP